MKLKEKEKVRMVLKLVINKIEEGITAVLFMDNTNIVSKGENAVENIQKMLEIRNRLCMATGGYIEDKNANILLWSGVGSKKIKLSKIKRLN